MNISDFQKTLMENFERYYLEQKKFHPEGDSISDDEWLTRCGINAAMFSMSTGMDVLKALYQQTRPATKGDQAQLIQAMIDVFLGCSVMVSTVGADMSQFCEGVLEIVSAQMGGVNTPSSDEASPENNDELPRYVDFGELN